MKIIRIDWRKFEAFGGQFIVRYPFGADVLSLQREAEKLSVAWMKENPNWNMTTERYEVVLFADKDSKAIESNSDNQERSVPNDQRKGVW